MGLGLESKAKKIKTYSTACRVTEDIKNAIEKCMNDKKWSISRVHQIALKLYLQNSGYLKID